MVAAEEVIFFPTVEERAEPIGSRLPVVLEGVRLLVVAGPLAELPEVPVVAGMDADLRAEVIKEVLERLRRLLVVLVAVIVGRDDEAAPFQPRPPTDSGCASGSG